MSTCSCVVYVTIYSTDSKFRPVSNFTELHALMCSCHNIYQESRVRVQEFKLMLASNISFTSCTLYWRSKYLTEIGSCHHHIHTCIVAMVNVTWSSHDHHMTITWPSHDHHMIITWPSHDHHMTITWSSHDPHMTIPAVLGIHRAASSPLSARTTVLSSIFMSLATRSCEGEREEEREEEREGRERGREREGIWQSAIHAENQFEQP